MAAGRQHAEYPAWQPAWQPAGGWPSGLSSESWATAATRRSVATLLSSGELSGSGRAPPRLRDTASSRSIVDDMMPMIWTLRLALMLPVSFQPNNNFRFRWLSLPVVLTSALWLALIYNAYATVRHRLDPLQTDGKNIYLWDLVPVYASSFALGYVIFLPITSWAVADRVIAMTGSFKRVEVMFRALHGGMPRAPYLRKRAMTVSVLSVALPTAMQTANVLNVPFEAVWMLPVLVHSVTFLVVGTGFWNLTCVALAHVANHQGTLIIGDFKRLGLVGLRHHRRIWLGLVKVLYALSAAWERTQTLLLGILFITFVCLSFMLTHMVAVNDWGPAIGMFLACNLVFAGIVSVCWSAQNVTNAIRNPVKMQLLLLSFVVKDEVVVTEIAQFLEEIYVESPRISVCRLGVLGRSSISYFFALAATYIVVLSQFSMSIENATTDSTAAVPQPSVESIEQ